MKSRKLFINNILLLFVAISFNFVSFGNDTLYYFVENVSEQSIGNEQFKVSTNKDEKKIGATGYKQVNKREDKYLIPLFISTIKENTEYKNLLLKNEKNNSSGNSKYLIISINEFNNNIEYQLHLYEDESILLNEVSFFINPENNNYKIIIQNQIQLLFNGKGGTNTPPEAKIRIDGNLIDKRDMLYRSHVDTILFDGSSSYDKETPIDLLKYTWIVNKIVKNSEGKDTTTNAYISGFNFEKQFQKLVISEPGKYNVLLEVNDGVAASIKDSLTVIISVISKPKIELNEKNVRKIKQNSLLTFKKNNYDIENIGYNITDCNDSSRFVLKYLYSTNYYRKYFLEQEFLNERLITLKHNTKSNLLTDPINIKQSLPGLFIYNLGYTDIGNIKYQLKNDLDPGVHDYIVYTDFKNVNSNYDTLSIQFLEKSKFLIYLGYESLKIWKGDAYYDEFHIDAMKVGLRGFISQRLYGELGLIRPVSKEISQKNTVDFIGLHSLNLKLNYDFLPLKSNLHTGKIPYYISGFVSMYQLQVLDESKNNNPEGFMMWGIGIRPRIQLFSNNFKFGVCYLDFEFGRYWDLHKQSYKSEHFGINLVYGSWNY